MAYSASGIIEASDYNTLAWGGTETYRSSPNNIAYVIGVGNGDYGYGQSVSGLENVAASDTVTATKWTSLVNAVNLAINHQGGTAVTPSPAIATGGEITYESALETAVGTAMTNRLTAGSMGSTTTSSNNNQNRAFSGTGANTTTITRTATFASADQARYFFNAGGKFNIVWSVANATNTSREVSIRDTVNTELNGINDFGYTTNGGRNGTGGTLVTNATSIGYYDLTTTNQTLVRVNSDNATYTGDYARIDVKSNGAQGSNGDAGSVITFTFTFYSGARGQSFNQAVNVDFTTRIDIQNPETTYLTNSWGTITMG